jgi:hypothetical protein
MPIDIIDTVQNQIHILDDGTTIADILHALAYVERERVRNRIKNKLRQPTGKPRGRPRKNLPVDELPKIESE